MALTPGARLGPYEILAPLGSGGMGEVYKARDTRLDRAVALKVLPSDVAGDPGARARFEREAHAIAVLSHPHICTVHDIGEHGGAAYLVMELLEGQTLAARLVKGPLPIEQVLSIAADLADALDKAHRLGIVHRDVKPANIMLTDAGPKLLDFGLAKLKRSPSLLMVSAVTQEATARPTAPGTILGTVHYMAPEQVEGREADSRSDIWALGAVIHEMATGKAPFGGGSPASVMGAILRDVPPALSTVQPLSPPVLDHVVSTCLEKDPDKRWQSAADIAHELRWQPGPRGLLERPRRSAARSPWLVAGAAMLIAAAALTALWQRVPLPGPVTRLEMVTGPSIAPQSMALSADGRQVAFVADDRGVSRLWVRRLDQATSRPISGTDRGDYPFWSQDGRSVGFFADGKLKRVDLPDGTPRPLADAPVGRGGTWNADGVILFAPFSLGPLMRISASGGMPEPVTQVTSGGGGHRWPQFLPDGRRFLFLVALAPGDVGGTYIGSLDNRDVRKVLPSPNAAFYAKPAALFSMYQSTLIALPFDVSAGTTAGEPVAVAQGVGVPVRGFTGAWAVSDAGVLAYRALPPGARQLTWVDRAGHEQGTVGPPDNDALASPSLSPDGQRVAVAREVEGNRDVWTIDVARNVVSRVTSEPSGDNGPIWTPDERLVFHSDRNGIYQLFRAELTGQAERLVSLEENAVAQSVSADGRTLVFAVQSSKTASDIWAMPMTGGGQAFPVVQTPTDDIRAQLSPDGRWLAYESMVSGQPEVYVQAFPKAGERWKVSQGGGGQARWRRDGRELFYVAPDMQLMAVSFAPAAKNPDLGGGVALFRARLATGINITNSPAFQKAQYDVAADGRFLMNLALEAPRTAPINLIINWPALLAAGEGRPPR